MGSILFGHPHGDDNPLVSKKIEDFFLAYPLQTVNEKLWEFYKSRVIWTKESGSEDLIFYEDLSALIENIKNWKDEHPQFIEPSFKEQTLVCLEGVVNLIKQAIPVGTIYNLSDDKQMLDLIIVLEKSCTKSYSEFENVIDLAMLGHENGTCTVHNYGLLNTLIQNGHLFYQTACVEKNIIYQKSTAESFTCANIDTLKNVKLDLEVSFNRGMEKACNFYEGAQYYLENGANDLTIFMLQQACELTYRTLLKVLRGRDVKCHAPAVLRKHLKRFAPTMMNIFSVSDDEELNYLGVLEDAYVKSRYQLDYSVDKELVLFLNEKVNLLQRCANRLFREKMQILDDYVFGDKKNFEHSTNDKARGLLC